VRKAAAYALTASGGATSGRYGDARTGQGRTTCRPPRRARQVAPSQPALGSRGAVPGPAAPRRRGVVHRAGAEVPAPGGAPPGAVVRRDGRGRCRRGGGRAPTDWAARGARGGRWRC
jgi:hypothetical protein